MLQQQKHKTTIKLTGNRGFSGTLTLAVWVTLHGEESLTVFHSCGMLVFNIEYDLE